MKALLRAFLRGFLFLGLVTTCGLLVAYCEWARWGLGVLAVVIFCVVIGYAFEPTQPEPTSKKTWRI